jgi:hypothetical protein
MALTVRVGSHFTIPLSANLLSVSSAFITVAKSLFENVDLSMTFSVRARALGARASGWPGATNLAQVEPEPDNVDLRRGVSPPAFLPR